MSLRTLLQQLTQMIQSWSSTQTHTHGTRELHINFAQNQPLTVQSQSVFIHSVQWQPKSVLVRSA
jgi:hypothetical protein